MDQEDKPSRISGGTRGIVLGLFGSNIFSLFVAGLYEFLALRGVINMMAAWVVLLATWMIGVVGICLSEWVWGGTMKQRFWTGALAAVVLGVALFGLNELVDHIAATAQTAAPTAGVSSDKQNGGQTAGSIINQGPVYNGAAPTPQSDAPDCKPGTPVCIAPKKGATVGKVEFNNTVVCSDGRILVVTGEGNTGSVSMQNTKEICGEKH